jgi:hypothetical protein
MPRGRIAGIIAALAVIGVTVAIALRPSAPPEPAVPHRVELDVPPVEAALWFVARYPEYFTSGEDGFATWLASLDVRDREFVLAMGQTLAWAWVEHELASFVAHEPDGLAREAIGVVRRKTLNQLEVNLEPLGERERMSLLAYVGDAHFADGVFARLVRGASNCEGQNHLLALLLDAGFESTEWGRELDADMAGIESGHELVRVSGHPLAQPMFVDAWANLPPFTVDDSKPHAAPLLAELGDPPARLIPGFPARPPEPSSWYAKTQSTRITVVPERDAPTMPVSLEVRAPALDPDSLARIDDPWQLYLYARVLHLYDDPRAEQLYVNLLERHCTEHGWRRIYVCATSMQLFKRVTPADRAPPPG